MDDQVRDIMNHDPPIAIIRSSSLKAVLSSRFTCPKAQQICSRLRRLVTCCGTCYTRHVHRILEVEGVEPC